MSADLMKDTLMLFKYIDTLNIDELRAYIIATPNFEPNCMRNGKNLIMSLIDSYFYTIDDYMDRVSHLHMSFNSSGVIAGYDAEKKMALDELEKKYESNNIKYWEMFNLLIDCGVSVNGSGGYGKSPLIMLAPLKDTKIAELLINKGADIHLEKKCYADNFNSIEIITPVLAAVQSDNLPLTRLLINRGADIKKCGAYELSAFAKSLEMLAYIERIEIGLITNKNSIRNELQNCIKV